MPRADNRPARPKPKRPKRRYTPPPTRSDAAQRTGARTPPPPPPPQPPKPLSTAFRPISTRPGATRPLEQARRQTRNEAARARRKLPDHPAIPRIPVKKSYTPAERVAVARLIRRSVDRAGVRSVDELYDVASRRQRRNIREVGKRIAQSNARAMPQGPPAQIPVRRVPPFQRGQLQVAGVGVDVRLPNTNQTLPGVARNIGRVISPLPLPGTVVGELGRATVENPAGVGKATVRSAIESITGIPQGVKAFIDSPEKALRAIGEDYERRYGPIFSDPERFRQLVQSEYGLTPFAMDALTAGAAAGRGLTLASRAGVVQRAAAALQRGGRVGRAVGEGITASSRQRPGLRYAGGPAGVRAQRTSGNAFVAIGQHAVDRRRAAAFDRRVDRAGLDRRPDGTFRERDGGAGVLPALRPGPGEVVPRGLRENPVTRKFTGRISREVGGSQSVARVRMLTTRHRVLGEVRKQFDGLDADETAAVKYMVQLGVRADMNGRRALELRRDQIIAAREQAGTKIPPILRDTNDELALIDRILSDPEAHLTPNARAASDELIAIQKAVEEQDPGLKPGTALANRYRAQAALLGVDRAPDAEYFRGVLRGIEEKSQAPGVAARAGELADLRGKPRAERAREIRKEARSERKAAERSLETQLRRAQAFRSRNRALERRGQPLGPEVTAAKREVGEAARIVQRLQGELRGARQEAAPVRGVKEGSHFRREERLAELEAAKAVLADKRSQLLQTMRDAPRLTPKEAERAFKAEIEINAHRQALEATRKAEKAMDRVLKAAKSKRHDVPEDAAVFAERVRAAADEAGLAEPGYWLSTPFAPAPGGQLATTGRGLTATNRSKRYEGRVFDVGGEAHTPDVFTQGIERNVKRRFQWTLVQANLDRYAYEWSRGRQGEGITIQQARKLMLANRVNPDTVDFLPANYVHPHLSDPREQGRGRVLSDEEMDQLALPEDARGAREAFDRGRLTFDQLERMAAESKGMAQNRYLVVDREVSDTIATRVGDSTVMRALEVILKQKPARIMLGALNVPWLAFQVASNAMLTGLGGGIHPLNVFGAHKWWRGLDAESKEAIEAELGITHGHHQFLDQPNLGNTNSHLVNAWRGFKATKAMRVAHRMNPLDAMFRADELQNNFFRRVLFYDRARKQAYRRMGSTWRQANRLHERLTQRVLALPPERQARAIAMHGEDFEQAAKHVNTFLGDYLRFSPAERFLLSRNVMFYGYLRFSLRFAFYTMPVGHPVMTNLLGNVGRLGAREIKELFGVPRSYGLPVNLGAQVYWADNDDPDNLPSSFNAGRLNPALNAATQMESANQALGLVSPMYSMMAEQMFEESTFTGKDWRVAGETVARTGSEGTNHWSMEERARIAARSALKLAFPYRLAEKAALEPSQSDDALVGSPRPLQWSPQGDAFGPIQRQRREFRDKSLVQRTAPTVIPFVPTPSIGPELVKRQREKEANAANTALKRKPKRRRRAPSTAGRYGGGGGRYGG